jgi:malate synthase
MTQYHAIAQLLVAESLKEFTEKEVLPGLAIPAEHFWQGVSDIVYELTPINQQLLQQRDTFQQQLDQWFKQNQHPSPELQYQFLKEIGYIEPTVEDFTIGTENVDDEIATIAGPQLVVPVMNARFALNAVNARWGSLYDALYGTDVIPPTGDSSNATGYDPQRGEKVIAFAKQWLNTILPLVSGNYEQVTRYQVEQQQLILTLANGSTTQLQQPAQLMGFSGDAAAPQALLFKHNGLHIILKFNPHHPIGQQDISGLYDIVLESALTTIMDCEDSVAAVDAEDKVITYRHWLGLNQQNLCCELEKNGQKITRTLAPDHHFTALNGETITLKGRSLMFIRNVGHLMQNPAILQNDEKQTPVYEGIMDAIFTSLIALYDRKEKQPGELLANSQQQSIYIVKPKMHGSHEVAFTDLLFTRVEKLLNLPKNTIKLGIMDEERRTSLNLKNCIYQAKERVVFINTGFLDRTGDEIHSIMQAGAVVKKQDMKQCTWLSSYEDHNVQVGLACGLSGRAQIGKGMWPMPDKMADMVSIKRAHPKAGANTAWVPSPTAATLHAMHYHEVNVFSQQESLHQAQNLHELVLGMLTLPLAENPHWNHTEVEAELDNNIQGILGYVVRWVDQGIGCSKVPDIHNVGLMEDRATLRISSQHIANWLLHGICTNDQVNHSLRKMAAVVDRQNADDPNYHPMMADFDNNLAVQAAKALIFQGIEQPNGYTEPLLHAFRAKVKSRR